MKIRVLLTAWFPRTHAVALLCLLGLARSDARAIPVMIDTTALNGQAGLLAFDLIGGDSAAANNTVSINLLSTDGVLDSTDPFTLTDFSFFNEVLREITFGTFLSFSLELTENVVSPGVDQFSFFLLDPITYQPMFGTNDPLGADALFAIDITGVPGGETMTFEAIQPGISWLVGTPPTQAVPDAGMMAAMVGAGLVGLVLVRRRLRSGD